MKWLLQILTWWNGQTLNTRFHTWRNGELVGKDEFGNSYYRTKGGKIDPALGYERRWVIYSGANDASRVPPEWHGWLHNSYDGVPESHLPPARIWEVDYTPNATGSGQAYRPQGALERGGKRAPATGEGEGGGGTQGLWRRIRAT